MARRTDARIMRMGAIFLCALLLVMAASFNLQRFPGFKGTDFHAQFTDASGLHKGNMVQVAGVKVGRVNEIRISGKHVTVDFDVKGAVLGSRSKASVEVLNLLGEKYLEIIPAGSGTMSGGSTIPVSRTNAGYDIVGTLSELTERTEELDIDKMSQALTQLGETLNAASPHIQSTFNGLSRISKSIAERDEGVEQLVLRAERVTKLLADRKGDLVTLMKQGDLVFQELIQRREAIHSLLVNAQKMSVALEGVIKDNQAQLKPALMELQTVLQFLRAREALLDKTLQNLGPYASILINVLGTGPWFDAYVPNFAGLVSGEFTAGPRK